MGPNVFSTMRCYETGNNSTGIVWSVICNQLLTIKRNQGRVFPWRRFVTGWNHPLTVFSFLRSCRMVDEAVAALGGLHIAVNNAGINRNASAEETSEEDWDATFALNTKGVFLSCQVRCSARLRLAVVWSPFVLEHHRHQVDKTGFCGESDTFEGQDAQLNGRDVAVHLSQCGKSSALMRLELHAYPTVILPGATAHSLGVAYLRLIIVTNL